MPPKRFAKYFLNLAMYMNDTQTSKPLVVPFNDEGIAKAKRIEFYQFRKEALKQPFDKPGQETLQKAIANLEKVEVRMTKEGNLEFDIKNEKEIVARKNIAEEAFDSAFKEAGFPPKIGCMSTHAEDGAE